MNFEAEMKALINQMNDNELRTLRARINGKLSRRVLTSDQAKAMVKVRELKRKGNEG